MLRGKYIILFLLLSNVSCLVFSNTPNFTLDVGIVKDICKSEGASSYPDYLTVANGFLFFRATNDTAGQRLWKTDGTASGTSMIKDISPGNEFININNILYFRVEHYIGQEYTHELWRTDGTDAETYMVKKISGTWGSGPYNFTNVNGILYFTADDEINGGELWRSDGTESGTYMVQDLNPGSGGSWPKILTVTSDMFYFSTFMDSSKTSVLYKRNCSSGSAVMLKDFGYDAHINYFGTIGNIGYFSTFSEEEWRSYLWRTDGTSSGTYKVTEKVSPEGHILLNSNLYLKGWDDIHGRDLWKTDGTDSGTVLVKDMNSNNMDELVLAGNNLFLNTYNETSGQTELWRSDGTEEGTVLLYDFNGCWLLEDVNGILYFAADEEVHGFELWKSDGTQSGTVLVRDLEPGIESSYPYQIVKNGNYFYVSTSNGLWKSDGTVQGTILIKKVTLNGGIVPFAQSNGLYYFTADDGKYGHELWRSDGTTAGTFMVKNIMPESSYPKELTEVNSILFFTANDGKHGQELWKSNRSKKGTLLIKDICAGPDSSDISSMTKMNSKAYFAANDGIHGKELWRSDGTEAGTYMVKDIVVGPSSCSLTEIKALGNVLYFVASDGQCKAIWKSDGTFEGTNKIINLYEPDCLTASGDKLFFRCWSELWKTDGTADGTVMLKKFHDASAYGFTDINGILYFYGDNGVHGTELWKSDGTEEGTVMVKDIYAGENSSIITALDFATIDNKILFNAGNEANGIELWETDGTEEGTMLFKDINPGSGDSYPWGFTTINNKVYFYADDEGGSGLWVTDGTSAGTNKVTSTSGVSSDIIKVNNMMYFKSDDETHGYELWHSDGTAEGTFMAKDIAPSLGNSDPNNLVDVNGVLFFSASDGVNGRELWYARVSLTGDFDEDEDVDFKDFAVLSEQWMLERLAMDISENKGDGIVNFLDWAVLTSDSENIDNKAMSLFSKQWLKSGAYTGDVAPQTGGDGQVDGLDLIFFAENWLERY
ncbi:MAG: hypothetical protein LLF92_03780 [Planctomycetaceae bacterium]|nr:hypothetical protein [Planctomycetaceae bacterium]